MSSTGEELTWKELGGPHLLQGPFYDTPALLEGGKEGHLILIDDGCNLVEEQQQGHDMLHREVLQSCSCFYQGNFRSGMASSEAL